MKFEETTMQREWENGRDITFGADVSGGDTDDAPSDAALGALLDDAECGDDDDAERRVRRLGARLARLDALNVGGMLAAATDSGGAGAALGARLADAQAAGEALGGRRARLARPLRAAPAAPHARSDAARADANARRLLAELARLFAWLDAPALDWPPDAALSTPEARARALAAGDALRDALRAEAAAPPALLRLAAVRERLRRLARAKDQLAAALARHLNNALIHLGNEAAHEARARHHAELLPLAPFMRWLKHMDERAFDALAKVYVGTWARVYERELRAAAEAARAALQAAPAAEEPLDRALALAEELCNAEQDFCARFFFLDVDVKRRDAGPGVRGAARAGRRRGGGRGRGLRGALGAGGAGQRGRGGQAGRRPRRGRARGLPGRRRAGRGAETQVRHPGLHPRAGGHGGGVRAHVRGVGAPRRPGALVPVAGLGHAARHPARRAPAHAARRAAHGELPPPARRGDVPARGRGAGRREARVPLPLRRRAARLRHAVLRAAAGEAHAVLRGRGRGGGAGRPRGRGLLPRRLQQARAAPRARAVPRARGPQVAAPAVPHGGEAAERGGRAAAGGVARAAGGVHRAARGAAGPHRGVLPGHGAGHAAHHAAHPRRLLRHRARALTARRRHVPASSSIDYRRRPV